MKRWVVVIFILVALPWAMSCSNEATATGAEGEKQNLPEDLRAVATAVNASPDSAELAPASEATSWSTTGEFVSPSRSELAPKIPGRVAAVHVDAGAFVHRGEPLATLESDYMRLDLQRAEAELSRARAAEEEAIRDLGRKKELRGKDSIPQSLYDRTLAAQEQASATREGAEAAVALAKQRVADAVIRAPLTGIVAERRTDVGERLGDQGIAFVVIQTAPLKLRFTIPEKLLGRVHAGQKVTATVDPYPEETFEGVISVVGGAIDPASRTMFAEAEFANADNRLRPGLFARVDLQLE